MEIKELIAAVDEWGRARQHSGYRAREAHQHQTDMAAGRATLAVEATTDEARLVWAVPLVELMDAGGITEARLRQFVTVADAWGFDRWMAGWAGTVAPVTGDEPGRGAWVEAGRLLLDGKSTSDGE